MTLATAPADDIAALIADRQSASRELDALRTAARESLFFFAKYVLGWAGLNERAHKSLCGFAQSIVTKPNGFGVAEDPRGTGKSTSLTCSIPQWALIQDPEACLRRGWLPLGPSANILIVSHKGDYAAKFLKDGRRAMETSPVFRMLFGDLLPERNVRDSDAAWKQSAYNVRRPPEATGFSVMALGTESAATSQHPLIVLIDDLVNEKNYKSSAEVASQVDWLRHSFNLVESTNGSRLVIENSWGKRDVNADLRERNTSSPRSVAFFSRSIQVCVACEQGRPLDGDGNPISEGHSYEDHPDPARPLLDARVKEPYAPYTDFDIRNIVSSLPSSEAWAQHFNHPLHKADLAWRESWLRPCGVEEVKGEGACVAFSRVVTPGEGTFANLSGTLLQRGSVPGERTERCEIPVADLECVVSLDPGLRRPGLACVGHFLVEGIGDAIFILEATAEKLSPRDQIFLLFDWVLRYRAARMVFEQAALQGYIGEMIPAMALAYHNERGVELPYWIRRPNRDAKRIVGAQVFRREGDKIRRIGDDLGPLFEQRLVFVRGDLAFFLAEYVIFPKGRSMDVLDAIRQAVRQLLAGRKPGRYERDKTRLDAAGQMDQYRDVMQRGIYGYGEGV